jgi:hypothetical protein
MQLGATRLHLLAEARRRNRALTAGLWIYFIVYCGFAVCFGIGLYDVGQPSRYPNPGMASQKPAPAVDQIAPEQQFPIRNAAEPSADAARVDASGANEQTVGEGTPQGQATKQSDRPSAAAGSKRVRVARKKKTRSPMLDYAAQPPSSGYQHWHSFDDHRPWRW